MCEDTMLNRLLNRIFKTIYFNNQISNYEQIRRSS